MTDAIRRHEVPLPGCHPVPLAHYLKALAVLRLVAEGPDPAARGRWCEGGFQLQSSLSDDALVDYFLSDYAPSPIVAPWNSGSGFYPRDKKDGIDAIRGAGAARLRPYRGVIDAAHSLLAAYGVTDRLAKEDKQQLLEVCRAELTDATVNWLDAAFVLTGDGPKYPPLLGTGGNDGRLDFTNNFMQRLVQVIDPDSGRPRPSSATWLRSALFAEFTDNLQSCAIGQFLPCAGKAANLGVGFGAPPVVNPWDFILMIEGTLVFAGAVTRKLESDRAGTLSYPFSVRQSGVGYGTAALTDESEARAELWLPLWGGWISYPGLRAFMAEGRATVAGRTARSGLDFARAIATLGVERGIDGFQRYGFQVRNGLAYYATPLGRQSVRQQPQVRLLDPIDPWLDRFLRAAKSDAAPSSVTRAARHLEATIHALTQRRGVSQLQAILTSLGSCEAAMGRSFGWSAEPKRRLGPPPPLEPTWLDQCDDGSVEFRLAAALASVDAYVGKRYLPIRAHVAPVLMWIKDDQLGCQWRADGPSSRDLVWAQPDLTSNLLAVLQRRLVLGVQAGHARYADRGRFPATLPDVAAFVEGRVDDARIGALLRGLLLLDWPAVVPRHAARDAQAPSPVAGYGLLKLCFAGHTLRGEIDIPIVPAIVRHAAAGNSYALTLAIRRLRASGAAPALRALHVADERLRRIAAALLIPLARRDILNLSRTVLRPDGEHQTATGAHTR